MPNISIYRQATKGQISTANHLLNTQDYTNQNKKFNPNRGKSNLLLYVDDGKYHQFEYIRNSNNQELMLALKQRENELDTLARANYKEYKLLEKQKNPTKKIRTVLQSKDLKKEFIIALGGDKRIDKTEFAKKVLKAVDAVLEHKSLTRDNIIGIFIHNDEKTLHAHIQYNDYSFQHHTTASHRERLIIDKNMPQEQKSLLMKLHRQEFGKYQDIVANAMNMERGERGSKEKHTTKAQFYATTSKEVEQLEQKIITSKDVIKKLEFEKSKTVEEYNDLVNSFNNKTQVVTDFEDKLKLEEKKLMEKKAALKQELDDLVKIKNHLRINSNNPYSPQPEVNLSILLAGLNEQHGLNLEVEQLEKAYDAGRNSLQKLSYPSFKRLIKNSEDLTEKINEKLELEKVLVRNRQITR